ncbi:hypothetical protein F7734_23325 [Scytonema sp. UIC 10036]|uniref:hypothetical protein n=1 Tax=Scytonema sp. UIC 10036 TaxID=2304196 RepID=UPI0012DAA940|nr:hypothetical protein [Scytonema sp. UIC 10036]MUG95132.1 hypothetical protein [Scytonema sp. UIC 10036]
MSWWEDKVEKPLSDAGNSIRKEVKSCFSGGCDPAMILNKAAKGASKNTAQGFAQPIKEEFNEAVDHLFNEKLNPFADKVDYIAQKRIAQSQDAAKDVVTHTVQNFSDLKNQVKGDVDELIANVDDLYKENLRLTFEEINQARAEAILGLRAMIGDIDTSLEERINQISITIMASLKEAKEISDRFTPGAFRRELVEPTFDRIDKLETKFFQDLNGVLDKLAGIADTTISNARDKLLGLVLDGLVKEPCRTRVGLGGLLPKLVASLDDMELYRYLECVELEQIDGHIKNNSSIQLIVDSYIQLQINAARMHIRAKGLGVEELQYICTKDWVKYGQASKFWSQLLT